MRSRPICSAGGALDDGGGFHIFHVARAVWPCLQNHLVTCVDYRNDLSSYEKVHASTHITCWMEHVLDRMIFDKRLHQLTSSGAVVDEMN